LNPSENADNLVRFSGSLGIGRAEEIRKEFLKALQGRGRINIVVEGASDADLSFFQIVCAMHNDALKQGREVRILGPIPAKLREIVELSGYNRTITCRKDGKRDCLWDMRKTEAGDER
jgi:anti-anti-sigma regulatory factor